MEEKNSQNVPDDQSALPASLRWADTFQRAMCIGLAMRHGWSTNDIWGTIFLLCAGYIDANLAKVLLARFLIGDDDPGTSSLKPRK